MEKPLSTVFALVFAGTVLSQGTQADYERAAGLARQLAGKVARDPVIPHWLPGGDQFWFRVNTAGGGWEFVFVDAPKGQRRPLFPHRPFSEALTRELAKIVSADQLPIDQIAVSDAGKIVRFRAGGQRWKWSNADNRMSADDQVGDDETVEWLTEPRRSTAGGPPATITFVNRRDKPIEVIWSDMTGGQKDYGPLAAGASKEVSSFVGHVWVLKDSPSTWVGAVAVPDGGGRVVIGADRPSRPLPGAPKPSHLVAPDGTREIRFHVTPGDGRKYHLIESSPKDQLQPKLHSVTYDKPGDKIAVSKPYLFDLKTKKTTEIRDDLFPQPWKLSQFQWAPDSSRFTFVYNQRGHQTLRLIAVNAATGETSTVIEETSPTFLNYSGKFFCHLVQPTNEVIWMSERSGWNHLYLYDAATSTVKNPITTGQWVVRGVDRVDDERRQIWFRAGGVYPDQDPYFVHFGRVNFDGTGLTWLTSADGTHSIEFSPNRKWIVDTHSRVDRPPMSELRRADTGQQVCVVEQADWSELRTAGWSPPERFVAKGADGVTDIHGIIHRPLFFDAAKKYPVLEQVYAGPHSAFVPKAFRHHHGLPATLAELGFIVVQVDGRGTSHRSKAFHDVCWKNVADAGFDDRIAWIKAVAAKYPQLDLTRVGIYGGSAGGQSAVRALITHADFYKVAVADCGCHDNRMDKIWWNEAWMGWPVGPHYEEQSNVVQAHRLQGKLLLTVGELDRNVDPASTMQLVNALIKADKEFELLVIPGAGHGAGETPYAARRRADFFVRHLLGVEPRRSR